MCGSIEPAWHRRVRKLCAACWQLQPRSHLHCCRSVPAAATVRASGMLLAKLASKVPDFAPLGQAHISAQIIAQVDEAALQSLTPDFMSQDLPTQKISCEKAL